MGIEARLKNNPKEGEFWYLYCRKSYKGEKCLHNHRIKCEWLGEDMGIEVRLKMTRKNTHPKKGKFWCLYYGESYKGAQGLCNHSMKCDAILCYYMNLKTLQKYIKMAPR